MQIKRWFIVLVSAAVVMTFLKPASARDFIGHFVLENYKENQAQFSYSPLIYHSIQVNTSAGPKILVLTGSDYTYRKWLRQYIAENKKLIIRVPDDQNDQFVSSKVFSLDVTAVHPIDSRTWQARENMGRAQDLLDGNGYVLVLDKHVNRSMLVKTVVERMGYKAILYKNGSRAMSAFRLQPEKFSLVLVHHDSVSSEPGSFVDQLLKIDPKVPVVIDTGYQNPTVKKRYLTRFSNVPSIFIRPVMLKELSKTIQALVQPNA